MDRTTGIIIAGAVAVALMLWATRESSRDRNGAFMILAFYATVTIVGGLLLGYIYR